LLGPGLDQGAPGASLSCASDWGSSDSSAGSTGRCGINSTALVSVRTGSLISPEEIDVAAAQTVNYTPPGD